MNNRSYWDDGLDDCGSDCINQVGCLEGVYRTEEIATPSAANGDMLNAIYIKDAVDGRKPKYSLSSDAEKYILDVTMPDGSNTYTLHLYKNKDGDPEVVL